MSAGCPNGDAQKAVGHTHLDLTDGLGAISICCVRSHPKRLWGRQITKTEGSLSNSDN